MSISPADFELVRTMVRDRGGISLGDGKEYLVEARLAPIAEREGVESVAELLSLVRRTPLQYVDTVTKAMATNETSFFRDVHPFEAIRELVGALGRAPSIWCGAASTGQEPYSVAMLLATHFPQHSTARILATDLSDDVLTRAATGRYSQLEVNRGLPAPMLVRWFAREGADWQLADAVRSLVTFRQLNLVRPLPPLGPFDIVLLRNVLIYFEPDLKRAVLESIAGVLRPGGHLVLGASETTFGLTDAFERVNIGRAICYRLAEGACR